MESGYEIVRYKQGRHYRVIIHSIERSRLHWHKEMEILLVLKGTVRINIAGTHYELGPDSLFLINSGEVHSTMSKEDNILAALQVHTDMFSATYPELEKIMFEWPQKLIDNPDLYPAPQIRKLMALIVEEFRKEEDGYQVAVEGYVNQLMSLILRNIPRDIEERKTISEKEKDKELNRIKRIADHIQAHYTEKITLNQLAEKEYISAYYLSHFFKNKMGISFQEYLNFIRLNRATMDLYQTENTITEIALQSGFANVKAFNKVFREFYGATPGEYRRLHSLFPEEKPETAYLEFDTFHAMQHLQKYLNDKEVKRENSIVRKQLQQIVIDVTYDKRPFKRWKRLASVGRLYDCLRSDLQEHIQLARKELKTKYLRFHSIFGNEMRVVTRDKEGKLSFSWQYIDLAFDFLIENEIHPILDFTFMPSELKSNDAVVFWYRGNVSPPKKLEEWAELVQSFVIHCLNRYGAKEVRKWYFEIWSEPDYMWSGSKEQYYELYKVTAEILLKADEKLKIAGPSIMQSVAGVGEVWLDDFFKFLNENNLPLHCFTYHVYGESEVTLQKNALIPHLGEKSHCAVVVDIFNEKVKQLKMPVEEIFVTEYNLSSEHQNYLVDTMFAACHTLHDFMQNHEKLDGVAFWTLSDIFEEDHALLPPFSGGFGLLTREGIKKPIWYAHYLLGSLGNQILAQEEDYIVTQRDGNIQILAFCYAYYDNIYMAGDRSHLSRNSRYDVFARAEDKRFSFQLQGCEGQYLRTDRILNRKQGSAYDLYEEMGAPKELKEEDISYLKGNARPHIYHSKIFTDESNILHIDIEIPSNGIHFVELVRNVDIS